MMPKTTARQRRSLGTNGGRITPQDHSCILRFSVQLWSCQRSRGNGTNLEQFDRFAPSAVLPLGVLLDQFQVESTPLCLREKPAGDGRPTTWLGGTVMPHWGACRALRASVTRYTTGNVGSAALCRERHCPKETCERHRTISTPYRTAEAGGSLSP